MLWRKGLLFAIGLQPLLWVVWLSVNNGLGPDPGKSLVLFSGDWALRFLLLALLVSPIKRWTGVGEVLRYRRMLGLYAFFYATIHLVAVFTYLLGWSVGFFFEEFSERPYMALGVLSWLIMLPLAITSNQSMIRILRKKWKRLHQLVYMAGILACAHFIWLVRSDYMDATIYALILTIALTDRAVVALKRWPINPFSSTS